MGDYLRDALCLKYLEDYAFWSDEPLGVAMGHHHSSVVHLKEIFQWSLLISISQPILIVHEGCCRQRGRKWGEQSHSFVCLYVWAIFYCLFDRILWYNGNETQNFALMNIKRAISDTITVQSMAELSQSSNTCDRWADIYESSHTSTLVRMFAHHSPKKAKETDNPVREHTTQYCRWEAYSGIC